MAKDFASERELFEWNEAMAHKYDPEAYHLRSNRLIRWIERRRVKAILHFLAASSSDTVLEVGCGAGNVLEQVRSRSLFGLDLSPFLLAKSQQRLAAKKAKLIQANAEKLPFVNGCFSRLICTEVLEHVRNPRQVICEMVRVASANAIVVISVPNEVWIDRVKGVIRNLGLKRLLLKGRGENAYDSPDEMLDAWHLHRFDLSLLRRIAAGTLHIRHIRAIPFTFLPLRYVVACELATPEANEGHG
jgi:ubiquinone/menaquinone biosynthesis C-methylase UbiE